MPTEDLKIRIETILAGGNVFTNLNKEIKSVEAELGKLSLQGKSSSTEYKNLESVLVGLTQKKSQLRGEVNKLTSSYKTSGRQLLEIGENIATVTRGIYDAVCSFRDFGKELIDKGAELNVLRSNFKGTEDDLNTLRIASAGVLSDIDLIKISNQANLLNINLKDQATILGFVEERFDLFGGNIKEGFEKLLTAIQGGTKGLRSLRIDTNLYKENLDKLAQSLGGVTEAEKDANGEQEIKIKNLPAETQMQLRLQAALQTINYTYDQSQQKTKDLKDKVESLGVVTDNAKAKIGEGLAKALIYLGDGLGITSQKTQETTGYIISLSSQLVGILPVIAQLKIAFPSLFTGIVSGAGAATIAIAGIAGALALILLSIATVNSEVERIKKYKEEHPNEQKYIEQNLNDNVNTKQHYTPEVRKVGKLELPFNPTTNQWAPEQVNQVLDKTKLMPVGFEKAQKEDEKLNKGLDETKTKIEDIIKKSKDIVKGGTNDKDDKEQTLAQWLSSERIIIDLAKEENKITVDSYDDYLKILSNKYIELKTDEDKLIVLREIHSIEKDRLELIKKINSAQKSEFISNRSSQNVEASKKEYRPDASIDKHAQYVDAGGKVEEEKKNVNEIVNQSLSFASQLGSILGAGADTFGMKLLNGLQQGLSLANSFASILSMITGIGSGGIFSLLGFASGGYVSGQGTTTSDSILARLSNGEFVMNARSTSLYRPILEAMNNQSRISSLSKIIGYANGGYVLRSQTPNITVVVQSEVEKTKAIKFFNNYQDKAKLDRIENRV